MKHIYSLLAFLFFVHAYAQQNKDASLFKHQIGIGATEFINSVFSSDENAYALEYRYKKNAKIAYRAGLSYNSETSEDGFFEAGAKVGIDKRLKLSKKWEFYYGIDVLAAYSNFKSSAIDLYTIGVSPLFGIMLHLSDNFSLSTEPLLFIRYNHSVDHNTFEIDNTNSWFQVGLGKVGYLQLNFHF